MSSLQLFQLTQHGRSFLASRRKTLLLATGILVAGGTTAYVQSRFRVNRDDLLGDSYECNNDKELTKEEVMKGTSAPKNKQKKGGLKSLQVLAAILLSEMGQLGAKNLLALVSIVVLRTTLSNRLAKVQGFLFRAAFLRRVPLFLRLISENILLCFLLSTMQSTSKYITGTLSLHFRKILTKLIHSRYFENMVYYKISHVDGRITNPEQRIASDVPRFCSELSEIVQDDLTAVTDGLLYTWRLCSYASPKYIFWILAYVLGAGAAIRNFSPAFGKLMSREQELEGGYRQLHSRLRTHSESIAFYGGEKREEAHIQQKFRTLVRHINRVLHDHWWFGMIQDFLLKYLGATVAVILIIEPFFSGHLRPDSSTLGRAEMLSNLRYHTSVIISLFQSLGTLSISARRLNRLSGYADRIHELMAISRELSLENGKSSLQRQGSRNCISEANYVGFYGVKVVTPTGNVLVNDLTLKVESGSNLLITGPNGSGKSSLFRVLGGLWPLVSGHIVKPGVGSDLNKEIFYVPQRPYTAVGTLRDQLIYPLTVDQEVEPLTDSRMVELLKNVDLEYLLDRYPPEKEVNWGDELSLGEQQRLGMARLFYHKPKFAILDECTSAVTTDMEERFCANVLAMGTSCITISHRPALVAFHDVVLSLDGEGGWSVHHRREDSSTELGNDMMKASETKRQSDAKAVQRAFAMNKKDSAFLNSKAQSDISEVIIASSPSMKRNISPSAVPQLHGNTRALPMRVAAMCKVLVPTIFDKQGARLLAVVFLVVSRTWVSDRIASLNGTTVKLVLEQDKASFIRLIGLSVLQSAASSFIAPSIRHLTARLALGGRTHLTQHLLKNYLRNNAFYKVFHMASKNIDADQRITHDLEKLTTDLSGLVTGMVKPSVDILWFTWRMKMLTGRRGVAILYAYMLLGLGFLRTVTPDFGNLISQEQQLEGTFRFMHERLCTHAESVAFFGGGAREKAMVESRFRELLTHSEYLLKKKWLFGILDDFITKQLPHNVTWGLSLIYAMEHKGDRASVTTQGKIFPLNHLLSLYFSCCSPLSDSTILIGELAHALRFLASVVSQSFLAFGDILELNKKFVELSGGINRIFELEELLDAAQSENFTSVSAIPPMRDVHSSDVISFSKVDIITPAQKMLVRELICDIKRGGSLLVTGPNGSGKSSIFRVLRGLWPIASGRLSRPSEVVDEEDGSGCGIFYVPQRPYTCLGTLRDQIIYPLSREEAEVKALKMYGKGEKHADTRNLLDTRLKVILESVRLNYLLEREGSNWDANLKWEDILSLGEQQRLGMARLFFHEPKFGILDECTNATSVDVEEHLYGLAKDMGITVVTSSQRPALIPFHSMELRLIDGEGNWKLRLIEQ
ncbi:ABC transporter D family member 1 isoform X1 [Glycine max]|uniref:ABC transporter D family member 1 isoform X1 n=1 Tax=Glycine max TaxID=3847 RepID=UPI000E21B4DF|nr:ABC transporter D family member 1 isoform X1 [Glycine max]XP_025985395.1 ABC transporter D family member 1 isoform X1 [Glycine max]XP_025985396.1 ABC transporter D family member 1 isoform X1 [Glycine max]|eukprot:XP_025985394.1 ABC transporter D family member 1 isoform X1 [Glycine max]